jgi:xylan 1,4-beta-xylosidase
MTVRRTGYRHNDPLSAWIDMGRPKDLSPEQVAQMRAITTDAPEQTRKITVDAKGAAQLSVPMSTNDVVLITLERAVRPSPERPRPARHPPTMSGG